MAALRVKPPKNPGAIEAAKPSSSQFLEMRNESSEASACLETLSNLINAGIIERGEILVQDLNEDKSFDWLTS